MGTFFTTFLTLFRSNIKNKRQCESIGDEFLISVSEKCKKLKKLWISGCKGITSKGLCKLCENVGSSLHALQMNAVYGVKEIECVGEYCENLIEWYASRNDKIEKTQFRSVVSRLHNLSCVDFYQNKNSVDDSVITSLCESNTDLRELYVSCCKKVTDGSLESAAKHLTLLDTIFLNKVWQVSFEGIKKVFESCKYLTKGKQKRIYFIPNTKKTHSSLSKLQLRERIFQVRKKSPFYLNYFAKKKSK